MNELTCSAPSIYSRDGRGNACKCKGKKAHLVVVVEYKSKYNRRGATDTKAAVEHSVTCHCDPARTPESPLSSCPHAEMGIKGLMPLIAEHAPHAIKEHEIKTLFGRKVAIDASMSMYQFLIAVRQKDGELLTNDAGETTSHLMGFFYRTIRIVEHGLKPAYVFDGKPPDLKKGVVSLSLFLAAFLFYELKTLPQLAERYARRGEAKEGEEEAKETGTAEDVERFSRRQVKVTREHNEECRRLLTLMGIPVIVVCSILSQISPNLKFVRHPLRRKLSARS